MVNKKFNYEFSFGGKTFELNVPVENVMGKDVKESSHRLIKFHNIPICFHTDLTEKLKIFLTKTKLALEDELGDQLLEMKIDVGEAVEAISQQFVMGHYLYGNSDVPTNDEIFADAYHELIHSSHYSSLLAMEGEHGIEMRRLLDERDQALEKVHNTCEQSMEMALVNLEVLYTDDQVNQLARQHIEATELEVSKWKSSVGSLREEQKRDFRQQVMQLYEASKIQMSSQQEDEQCPNVAQQGKTKQQQQNDDSQQQKQQKDNFQQKSPQQKNNRQPQHFQRQHSPQQQKQQHNTQQVQLPRVDSRREDSFTVHLGAQMKTSHNLRLLSCGTFALCALPLTDPGQRLQTAMSVYSDRLCGMVLLEDGRLNSLSGVKKELARVCEGSTDFHFKDLHEQMESIKALISQQQTPSQQNSGAQVPDKLNSGEIYITRHSNLSQVHVIFHVVVDDSVHGDVTSRHPVLLAYRNVVKTAFKNDIKTITMPLLLVHEMTEDMTIGWCLRRAELVLKCLKGFVMEMFASEGSFNIQLIVPPSLSNETFHNIASMIPSIFRMSNPLVAKSQ